MRKGKIIAGLLGIALVVSVPFIYNQVLEAENKVKSGMQQKASYQSHPVHYNDLVRRISKSLLKTDDYLGIEHRELPDSRYLIHVKLPRYNVTQKVTEEVMQRIENVIKENHVDKEQLFIKITSFIDIADLSSPQEQEKLDAFYEQLNEDGGFFEQAGKELDKAGYSLEAGYRIAGMVYSTKDVRLHIIVPDNEEINDHKQQKISNMFKDTMTRFKLDVEAFTFKVSRVDDPSEYKE